MNPADLLPSAWRVQPETLNQIAQAVADAFGLRPRDLRRRTRREPIVWPRQVAMWLMTVKANPRAAAKWFNKDRTTVLHACKKVSDAMDCYPKVRQELAELKDKTERTSYELNHTITAAADPVATQAVVHGRFHDQRKPDQIPARPGAC